MNTTMRLRFPRLSMAALVVAVACLSSCGGGGVGSGGTGRSEGLAAGTVNGFGSIIVDSVVYDDRNARVVAETAPGLDDLAEVKFGHRVAVEYTTQGVADVVHVDATVAGPVASVAAGQITVLGQTIVVSVGATFGPVTQFGGGYSMASDVRVGDPVEVHGIVTLQGNSYVIDSTRIDKLAAAPAFLRATGIVTAASTASSTFSLGQLTVDAANASFVPAGSSLAAGRSVTILAPASSLSIAAGGGLRVHAAQVRVRELEQSALDAYLSGLVARLDTTAKTFDLDGHAVSYAAATLVPASATLSNGLYVQVRGTVAIDGSLRAASVAVRNTGSDNEAELRGNVSAFTSVNAPFTVRGVNVDARGATISGCPAPGLTNGRYVEVHGATSSTGVLARSIDCEGESSGSTIEREGVASAVDVGARAFTLTPDGRPAIRVSWSDSTFFGDGLTPATLAGTKVQVEGSIVSGDLVAAKIKRED